MALVQGTTAALQMVAFPTATHLLAAMSVKMEIILPVIVHGMLSWKWIGSEAAVCGTVECIKPTAMVRLFAMTTLFLNFAVHTMHRKK